MHVLFINMDFNIIIDDSLVSLNGINANTLAISCAIKVAIAHSLVNAEKIIKLIEEKKCDYTFIEIMACPGGCIGGGGQPIQSTNDIKLKRMDALYDIDNSQKIRKSHENPDVITLYSQYLKEPLSPLAHDLLHTHYHKAATNPYDFSHLK